MQIALLEVVWILDDTTNPAKGRMVACIHIADGLFFRITSAKWQTPVRLHKVPDHPFLHHDSFLECGEPLELDDYIIDQALAGRGVIGEIARHLIPDILAAVDRARTLSSGDKAKIRAALESL